MTLQYPFRQLYCVKHIAMATGYTKSGYVDPKEKVLTKHMTFENYTSQGNWVDLKPRGFANIENQIRGFEQIEKHDIVQIEGVRSAGITTALLNYMLYLFQHTNNNIIYIAHTNAAAQEVATKFKTLLNALDEDPSTESNAKNHIGSKTGADIFFKSIFDRNAFRGIKCTNLIIDNIDLRSKAGAKFYSDNGILRKNRDPYDLTLELNLPTELTKQLILCTSGFFNNIMCKEEDNGHKKLNLQIERKVDEYLFKYINREPKPEKIELEFTKTEYQYIQSKADKFEISEQEYIRMTLGFVVKKR